MARTEYDYQFGHHDAILDQKLTQHLSSTNNPHRVTATQVGLGNVANLAPVDLPISNETQEYVDNFVKFLKVEQNTEEGIAYIYLYDGKGEIISKQKIITMGSENIYAKYDSEGNEIVKTYSSELIFEVDDEGNTFACLYNPDKELLSKSKLDIKKNIGVKSGKLIVEDDKYYIELTNADDTAVSFEISEIYSNLINEVDSKLETIKTQLEAAIDLKADKNHTHDDRYIKEEIDPLFTASPAAGITQENIDKWNSGMTSVSWNDIQNKPETFTPSEHTHDQYLEESDLDGYATEQWVEDQGYLTEHQDISGKVDKEEGKSLIANSKIEKLDRIEDKAQVNKIEGVRVNGDIIEPDENKIISLDIKDTGVEHILINDSGTINYTAEPNTITTFTSSDIDNLTIEIPSDIDYKYLSEIILRGKIAHDEKLKIVNKSGKLLKYVSYGRVVQNPTYSETGVLSLFFEYNGLILTCYLSEEITNI